MSNSPEIMYSWPTWWGSANHGPNPPEVVNAPELIRGLIGGLQAKKVQGGPAFPVRSGKELMIRLREALDELGYQAPVVAVEGGDVPTEKGTCAFVKTTVELRCKDGSFTRFVGVGHGSDRDDKGGGKASTYAWKDALCKGLSIPDAEMVDTDDESGTAPKRAAKGAKKATATFEAKEDGSDTLKRLLSAMDNLDVDGMKVLAADARSQLSGTELRAFADAWKQKMQSKGA
jgi:hypothetical protein